MWGLIGQIISRAYGVIGPACKQAMGVIALILLVPVAAWAQDKVIAILGDSLVAGYGLPPGEGLVPALQARLDAQSTGIRLINAGVSGDTTAGGLARLDWTLGPDVDALVVSLGGNDMLRGLPVDDAQANLDAILRSASARNLPVLLIGFRAPANWGPDYKRNFDAMYPQLATTHGAFLMPSFTAPLSGGDTPGAAMQYLQADGLHPNPKGVALLVEALAPYITDLAQLID